MNDRTHYVWMRRREQVRVVMDVLCCAWQHLRLHILFRFALSLSSPQSLCSSFQWPTPPCRFSATVAIWELLGGALAEYKHNSSLPVAPTSGGNYKNTMHEWKKGTKVSDSYHNKFEHVHRIGLGYLKKKLQLSTTTCEFCVQAYL